MLSKGSGKSGMIYLRIGGLKEKRPRFEQSIRKDDGTFEIEEWREVEGVFKSISFKDINFTDDNGKEKTRRVFDLILVDGEETYCIQSGFTGVSRSLLNSLISRDTLGRIFLSLYLNRSGYNAIALYTKDEGTQQDALGWKLSNEEQMKLVKVIDLPNGDKFYDRTELDAYLEKEASLIMSADTDLRTPFEAPERSIEEITAPVTSSTPEALKAPASDDDLPF